MPCAGISPLAPRQQAGQRAERSPHTRPDSLAPLPGARRAAARTGDLAAVLQVDGGEAGHGSQRRQARVCQRIAALPGARRSSARHGGMSRPLHPGYPAC